jgi:phosphoglycerate dehydrogenase-like enzyme
VTAEASLHARLRVLLLAVTLAAGTAGATPSDEHAARVARLVGELELVESAVPVREDPRWRRPERIVVRAESPAVIPALRPFAPGVELVAARTQAEAAAAMEGAQAVIGWCTREIVAAGSALHWIQLFAAGSENCLAIPAVRARGLVLTNMQRISGPEIAEHALALLLALTRGLDAWIPARQWNDGLVPHERTWELGGRTLLVVGLGGIGSQVARRADALGMRVIATRARERPRPPYVDLVAPPDELLRLAAEADAVINAAPLTPETAGIFAAEFFAALKPGAYFINVGRGRSVVTADLVAALTTGRLGGAGLDVTDPEPLAPDHPLWRLPNVIITPHVAARSDKVYDRMLLLAQENLRRYVAGERLLSVVDPARGY